MSSSAESWVIWITGFSGAGKTSVAKKLKEILNDNHIETIFLDGDEVRATLGKTEGTYSQENRKELAYIYARLSKLLSDQHFKVIVATISMFEEVRQWNRLHIKNYIEVYLKVSQEERLKRDPKKLYASGCEMVSTDSMHYEEPLNPDLVFEDRQGYSAGEIASQIVNHTIILNNKYQKGKTMKTEWNYSELAKPYLNRPAYSEEALETLFSKIGKSSALKVCDVGAGVAHLTIPLLARGFIVDAVEPNDEMRALGRERTVKYPNVAWYEGTGEQTGRESETYDMVTFGSSFNVTDRPKALKETVRILKPQGWFACMWNHRDLDDDIQKSVERIIKNHIPDYDYGTRREDQEPIIIQSGLFDQIHFVVGKVSHTIAKDDWINAWKSHATLARQAGDKFYKVVNEIEAFIKSTEGINITIPYTTRIWFAQKAR